MVFVGLRWGCFYFRELFPGGLQRGSGDGKGALGGVSRVAEGSMKVFWVLGCGICDLR